MVDVTTVVNSAVQMAMGDAALAALDSTKVVDTGIEITNLNNLGQTIDQQGLTETVLRGLITQLAIIEIEDRAYKGDLNVFMVRDTEWGGFVERVCFGMADIVTDPMWNIYENSQSLTPYDYAEGDHKFYSPTVSTKVYYEGKAIMTPISRTVDQLKEAFKSWEQMNSFLSGVSQAVRNTIEQGITSMRHMLAQDAIAFTTGTLAGAGSAIHLLDLTDDAGLTTSNTTAEEAMKDPDVLAFILQIISETRDNMGVMTSAFNDGTVPTFTPMDETRLILLNKFDKACRFLVKANTFNKEDLAIGSYDTTTAWQGIAASGNTDFNFKDCSTVYIAKLASGEEDKLGIGIDYATGEAYEHAYCIGLLFDRKALGICPYKRKVSGHYVATGDFFNEFNHTLLNLLLDSRYNMVSFWLDRAAT